MILTILGILIEVVVFALSCVAYLVFILSPVIITCITKCPLYLLLYLLGFVFYIERTN